MKKTGEDYFLSTDNPNDAVTAAPKKETLVQEVHTDRPEATDSKRPTKEKVREAVQTINIAIELGYRFSDEEMDTGIRMSLTRIPEPKKGWFLEIATMLAIDNWLRSPNWHITHIYKFLVLVITFHQHSEYWIRNNDNSQLIPLSIFNFRQNRMNTNHLQPPHFPGSTKLSEYWSKKSAHIALV